MDLDEHLARPCLRARHLPGDEDLGAAVLVDDDGAHRVLRAHARHHREMSERFDLLVTGGELLDPGAGRSGPCDVGITGDRVAALAPDLRDAEADRVLDATGRVVVPGLVDLHTHVAHELTCWGIDAGALAPRSGATTWVDAGSAGGYLLAGFRRHVVAPAPVRVLAFLNVSSIGLVGPSWELAEAGLADEELCVATAAAHRDFVVGIKARVDRFTVGARGLAPLDAAVRSAERAGLPLMVHVGHGPPAIEDVIDRLRPGDLLTHCATGRSMRLVEEDGRTVRPAVRRALERGVLLDLGHGSGGFSFAVAEALLEAGVPLPICSSDAHQFSVNGPMFDLPTCMTKLLALGVALPEVVRAATSAPAAAIGRRELGTLAVGGPADLAVLDLTTRDWPVADVFGEVRTAPVRVRVEATVVAGRILAPGPISPPAPWVPLSDAQRAAREALARGEDVDLPAVIGLEDQVPPPLVGGAPARD
jgi:dihydroorotase